MQAPVLVVGTMVESRVHAGVDFENVFLGSISAGELFYQFPDCLRIVRRVFPGLTVLVVQHPNLIGKLVQLVWLDAIKQIEIFETSLAFREFGEILGGSVKSKLEASQTGVVFTAGRI